MCRFSDYEDKPLDKPLKLVLKVGGSEVTELSGSGHDSSYYDDRSDHEWERHKEKKKKKKKKSEKEKEKYADDEERKRRKVSERSTLKHSYLDMNDSSNHVVHIVHSMRILNMHTIYKLYRHLKTKITKAHNKIAKTLTNIILKMGNLKPNANSNY